MSAIAVNGCTIGIDTSGVVGTIHVTAGVQPSNEVKVNGKGVWFNKINVTLDAGATYNGGTLASPASWDITGTADSILNNGQKAVQEGDSGTSVMLVFPMPSGGSQQTTVKAKVSNAGQSDVTAL